MKNEEFEQRNPLTGLVRVFPNGYRIADREGVRVLVPVPSPRPWRPGRDPWSSYDPFSKPALFGRFQRTPATEAGILGFAARFGQLYGQDRETWVDLDGEAEALPVERVDAWAKEILRMKRVWQVWESLPEAQQTDDPDNPKLKRQPLPEFSHFRGQAFHLVWEPPPGSIPVDLEPGSVGAFESAEDAAREFLYREVHSQLVALQPSFHRGQPFSFSVACLRDALWYQLANWIAGGREYRVCPNCGDWFPLDPRKGGSRRSRKFCSDSCKSSTWQKTHAKTKEGRS